MPIPTLIIWLFCTSLFCGVATRADTTAPIYTLRELIDKALSHNGEIEEKQWRVEAAMARLRQARAARILPRLRLQNENGLTPEAKGDIFNPPQDTTGLRPLGPFNRTKLEFIQPLYTFGMFASGKWGETDCPVRCPLYKGPPIDYTKVHCPEAERIHATEALDLTHRLVLGSREDMDLILDAMRKIRDNVDELKGAAA